MSQVCLSKVPLYSFDVSGNLFSIAVIQNARLLHLQQIKVFRLPECGDINSQLEDC